MNPERGPWTNDMLQDLEQLSNAMREAMRLWPVVGLGVQLVAGADLAAGEYVIPKGSEIMVPFFALFR